MRKLPIIALGTAIFPAVLASTTLPFSGVERCLKTDAPVEGTLSKILSVSSQPAILWEEGDGLDARQSVDPSSADSSEVDDSVKADDHSQLDSDLRCLALNIYHEARSEPESGQIAVASVTLNRVASKAFPGSICGVVKQGGQKRHRCQFSWWCDGKSDRPTDQKAWQHSLEIGRRVLADKVSDPTHGALYYHARYVKPKWSHAFKRTVRIGSHLFYRPSRI